jgi:predicted nucleic acid-binding protein
MSVYADTSVLVSYYLSDANSQRANVLLTSLNEALIFTRLHRLEFVNALELGIFRGHFTRTQTDQAWNDLVADLRIGRLQRASPNWPSIFRAATRMSRQSSASVGCRSLDLLHVAAATVLELTTFLSFDQRQTELANKVGLQLIG